MFRARIEHVGLLLFAILLLVNIPRGYASGYVANQVLVKFSSDSSAPCRSAALGQISGTVIDSLEIIDYYVVQLADTGVMAALASLDTSLCVDAAQANGITTIDAGVLTLVPDDSHYTDLWHLNNTGQGGGIAGSDIHAEEGWAFISSAPDVVIAISDTGVDYYHEDLDMWHNPGESGSDGLGHYKETNGIDDDSNGYIDDVYGWSFVEPNNQPWDHYYHGTATAGYAAALGDNGKGFTGVSWDSKIMALQIITDHNLSGPRMCTVDSLVKSVQYAVDNGAQILNCSWQLYPFDKPVGFEPAVQDAFDAAGVAGLVIVCGAGNDGVDDDLGRPIPATYNSTGLITVAATANNDSLADSCYNSNSYFSSNYGDSTVDLAAPGCDVWGMYPVSNYTPHHSGTSASAPIVAGAAALLIAQHPTWTNVQIKDRIMMTVDTLSSLYFKTVSHGRLNLARALDNVPPSAVSFTYERGHHSVKVMWTETGDDSTVGAATVAAIRWSTTTPLNNETAFNGVNATAVPLDIPLGGSGTEHCITFTDLAANHTYYVAVKLEDGEFNWSSIASGSVSTLGSGNTEVEECPLINRLAEAHAPVTTTDGSAPVWALDQARPNPTSGKASIDYSVKVGGPVRIGIYNVAGRLVRTLVNEIQSPGRHTAAWDGTSTDGSEVRGGVYFYRMTADGWKSDHRLVVLRQ